MFGCFLFAVLFSCWFVLTARLCIPSVHRTTPLTTKNADKCSAVLPCAFFTNFNTPMLCPATGAARKAGCSAVSMLSNLVRSSEFAYSSQCCSLAKPKVTYVKISMSRLPSQLCFCVQWCLHSNWVMTQVVFASFCNGK